jgi:hypothetical protein
VHRTKIWHGGETDEAQLKKLLEDHHRWTGSKRARELLDTWAVSRTKFVKVFPNEYKRALAEMHDRKVELASSGNNAHVGLEPHALVAHVRNRRGLSGNETKNRGKHDGKITGFMEHERIEEGYKPVPSASSTTRNSSSA